VVRFVTLATRAYYGALITEAGPGSPFTQRFFGGGQNLNRGYAPLQQGPKVGAAPNAQGFATVAVPIGGKGTMLFSGELRIRTDFILNHLGFVMFVDASRVDDLPSAPWTGAGLEIAPGLGLRYITPFGPVRLDVGWVLNPKDVLARAVTSSTGGVVVQPTVVSAFCHGQSNCINQTRWAYHLTLGEAF
jgi:translocation and assembly module TamA